jgi:nucleotide-binding universal stress UspA family protein
MLRSPLRSVGLASTALGANTLALFAVALCQPLFVAGLKMLAPDASGEAPFLLFGGAIVLAASIGGAAAGIASVGLSAVLAAVIFMPPRWALAPSMADAAQLGLFLVEGAVVSIIIGALRGRAMAAGTDVRMPLGLARGSDRWSVDTRGSFPGEATESGEPAEIRRVRVISVALYDDRHDDVVARLRRIPLATDPVVHLVQILQATDPEAHRPLVAVRMRSALDDLAHALPDATVSAELRVAALPDRELAAIAGQRPDLLVITETNKGRIAARSRGSLERLVRHRGVPLLVVKVGARQGYRCPLIALESPAPRSRRVVELAQALAAPGTAEMTVVHVLDGLIDRRMSSAGAPHSAIVRTRRELRLTIRARITSWLGDRSKGPIHIVSGDPAAAVLEVARHAKPDLLALGVEERWSANPFGADSVISAVLGSADADVLIVPTQREHP